MKRSGAVVLAVALAVQSVPIYAMEENVINDEIVTAEENSAKEKASAEAECKEEIPAVEESQAEIQVVEEYQVEIPVVEEYQAEISAIDEYPEEVPAKKEYQVEDPAIEEAVPEQSEEAPEEAGEEQNEPTDETEGSVNEEAEAVEEQSETESERQILKHKKTAEVEDFVCDVVETNPKYQYISFKFRDETENIYECFVTGLEGMKEQIDYTKAVAQGIVNYFLNPDGFMSDISFTMYNIDAEKYSTDNLDIGEEGTYGYPYSDSLLCWAATDSNMLEFAGWNGPFADEDEIFTAYTDAFFDNAGFEYEGLAWYLNGVFPYQNTTPYGNQVIFPDFQEYGNDEATQQRAPGTGLSTGGYVNDYYYGNVAKEIMIRDSDIDDESVDTITENLKAGNAVGMGVRFIDEQGEDTGGHALTVFGYIKNLAENGLDSLKALLIADSDNDKWTDDSEFHTSAKDTEGVRREKPNTLNLEYLELSNRQGYLTYNMPRYSEDDTLISTLVVLEARDSVSDELIEINGTRDSVNTPDIVLTRVDEPEEGKRTFATGETIRFFLHARNVSYTRYEADDEPTINFVITIYKDGEVYDEFPYEGKMIYEDGSPMGGALQYMFYESSINFHEAGTYAMTARIDSVVDKDGNVLPEAYTTNNYSKNPLVFTICEKEKPQPDPTPKPDPSPKPQPTSKPQKETIQEVTFEETEESICDCYCTKFGLECICEECGKVKLEKNWRENIFRELQLVYMIQKICNPFEIVLPVEKSEKLNAFLDKEYFCKDLYKVSKNEEGYLVMELDGEFVRKIGAGEHELIIETDKGYIMYHFTIG